MNDKNLKKIQKYIYEKMNKEDGVKHSARRTKIVATIGPSSETYDTLLALVRAGVNVFRLNFSHGSYEKKKQVIDYIRTINADEPYTISVLGDLQGPKLRVGEIENDGIELKPKDVLTFTTEECVGNKEKVYISYSSLHSDVIIGNRILLDDGKLVVRVKKVLSEQEVQVEVENGGMLKPNKGVNLPDTNTTLPALTEKDKKDLDFIIANKLDWVALSFVRREEDIQQIKTILYQQNSPLKIIAKIEKPEAVNNIESIIQISDGIMIARGDLGVEVPVEITPLIQKKIIALCMHYARPVIVATQMMESMIDNVQLNRGEASDVANSVLDGSDALMLSGETAVGQHPVLVIETMSKIIHEIETGAFDFGHKANARSHEGKEKFLSYAICSNTCSIASAIKADAIIGMTQSGSTAFVLSSYRPQTPIYIFTKVRSVVTQLSLSWGVRAFYYDKEYSIDKIFSDLIHILKERKFVKTGNLVVHTGSIPIQAHLPTNMIKVDKVT